MPEPHFGLVLFLGLLYHLKNPFYVLERFSRVSPWVVLSTRVAREAKQDGTRLEHLPVAYLLDSDECNNDATNYWIFTPTGLRRLLSRVGWRIHSSFNSGDKLHSNPSDLEHDERLYLLARSTRFS